MGQYCNILLKPVTKVIAIVFFLVLVAASAYSTSFLRQEFDFTTVVPSDSYLGTFFDAYREHTEQLSSLPGIYFRNVDQSDPLVQEQMIRYVNELVSDSKYFASEPPHFWLLDFLDFEEKMSNSTDTDFASYSFSRKMDLFLQQPIYGQLYRSDIVLGDGEVTASRTFIAYEGSLVNDNVKEQINALESQRAITRRQPVNAGKSDWSFFSFSTDYYVWEFYSVAVQEIITTTVMGVVAVALIAALFIPHPSGTLWVTPLICVVYIDLLGLVQVAGITVNPTLYIGMVMSIGLVVDYLMHFVFKYFEVTSQTPAERVREVLTTLGASIAVGGASTLLGVVPLAFSTSEIFWTIFVVFLGIVVLGLAHGLILMPVILSLLGPVPQQTIKTHDVIMSDSENEKDDDTKSEEGTTTDRTCRRSTCCETCATADGSSSQ